jgi:polar amino acid transport system substrate-binding protein
MLKRIGLVLSALLPALASAAEEQVISLLYYERPPLIYLDREGGIRGLLADPAAKVFAQARLPVRWVRAPPNRALQVIKADQGEECAFGWYKSPERESFAVFSLPYLLDRRPVGLVRGDFAVAEGTGLADLLARADLRLTVRQNVVYGDYVQGLIDRMPPQNLAALNIDSWAIARMIHARYTDLTIVAEEEVDQVIAKSALPPAAFRVVPLNDIPHPEYRYIVCNHRTAARVMERIDKAINELGLP